MPIRVSISNSKSQRIFPLMWRYALHDAKRYFFPWNSTKVHNSIVVTSKVIGEREKGKVEEECMHLSVVGWNIVMELKLLHVIIRSNFYK